MGDEDDAPDDAPQAGAEITELGPPAEVDSLWRRHPGLVLLLGASVVVAIVVVLVRSEDVFSDSGGSTGSTSTVSSSPVESLSAGSVRVAVLGNPLLGVAAGWELYGRGPGEVVRIQFARGRIVRTGVPALQSSGPVSFVSGADGVLVRPTDVVPGYVVSDDHGLREPPGSLDRGGPVFPGPDTDHVWLAAGEDAEPDSVVLVRTVDGHPTTARLGVPAESSVHTAIPDQRGYLVFSTDVGVYDVTPNHSTRVTTGRLLAVGPTRWLIAERDGEDGWRPILVNRSTGRPQPLPTRAELSLEVTAMQDGTPGVISPDGTMAAVPLGVPSATDVLLVNLVTGFAYQLSTYMGPGGSAVTWQSMVWSPDSEWLFLAVDGHIRAIDPHAIESIDLTEALAGGLPTMLQLSMRAR
jgi:hypothetical protein